MEHVNVCFCDLYKGGLWEDDLYVSVLLVSGLRCIGLDIHSRLKFSAELRTVCLHNTRVKLSTTIYRSESWVFTYHALFATLPNFTPPSYVFLYSFLKRYVSTVFVF